MRRLPALLMLGALLALAVWPAASPRGESPAVLVAHFIDVGQGDASWVRLPCGTDILVDGGDVRAGPTVVAYLLEQGVNEVELVVATHGHAEHIGGLLAVLETLPVAEVWLESVDCATLTCQALYTALEEQDVPHRTVRAGESHAWGDVTGLVLNPREPLYAEANNNSIVLRLSYGLVSILLTGDAETGAEGRILRTGLPLSSQILKVGHHGSASSSGTDFLAAVGPREAIISVGLNNPYGHPDPTVIALLEDLDARVWRTDQQGNIIVTTQGITYTVQAVPHATPEPPGTLPPGPTATAIPTPTPTPTRTPMPTGLRISLPLVFRG